jgi:hypothetical protein
MIGWIAKTWRGSVDALCRLRWFGWRPTYRLNIVEDLPDRPRRDVLYVVAEGGYPLHASMACPRGRCATVLNMNLAPDEAPRWSLAVDDKGAPTLAPSVWRKRDCGCHFFLCQGRLDWCD